MANDKTLFPMIPQKAWWDLRKKFIQSIPGVVTTGYLAASLDMKETSARANVLPYLEQLGIIDDEGRTLDRARQWRDDAQYPDVCRQMREEVYPQELLDAVPNPSEDRDAASRWFANHTGKGQAAVHKMVGVYSLLMDSDVSGKHVSRSKTESLKKENGSARKQPRASRNTITKSSSKKEEPKESGHGSTEVPNVYINLQVHVSSDATPDQIDQIFASMSRHIYRKG